MLCKSESAAQFDVVVGDVTMYFCLCGKKWGMVCVKENSDEEFSVSFRYVDAKETFKIRIDSV